MFCSLFSISSFCLIRSCCFSWASCWTCNKQQGCGSSTLHNFCCLLNLCYLSGPTSAIIKLLTFSLLSCSLARFFSNSSILVCREILKTNDNVSTAPAPQNSILPILNYLTLKNVYAGTKLHWRLLAYLKPLKASLWFSNSCSTEFWTEKEKTSKREHDFDFCKWCTEDSGRVEESEEILKKRACAKRRSRNKGTGEGALRYLFSLYFLCLFPSSF